MKTPWPESPLGEVLTERRETPKEEDVLLGEQPIIAKIRFSDGGIELRPSGVSRTNLISIYPGDLVLSGINAVKGAIALYEPPVLRKAAATIHYSTYIIDKNRVVPRFIWMLLRHDLFRERLERYVPNGIKTELKARKFLAVPVPLPSLHDQQRIVAKIDQIATRIEEARRLSSSVEESEDALLGAIITNMLSYLPLEGYLQDILWEKPRNGWSPRCNGDDSGVAVLTLSAVYQFTYSSAAYKITNESTDQNAHYWLKPGDLLMSRSNSIELVGNAAIYTGSPAPCIYPDLLMRLRVREDIADVNFVHYWLQSRTVRQYIKKNAKGTSPTMKKISQGVVMNIPWPKGLSIQDQKEYITHFRDREKAIHRLKQKHNTVAQELEVLMPSLLDQAFRGEL